MFVTVGQEAMMIRRWYIWLASLGLLMMLLGNTAGIHATSSAKNSLFMSHLIARHGLQGWWVEVLPDLRITVRAKHPSDIAVTTMGLYYRPSQRVPWQGWLSGSGRAAIGLLPAPGAKQITGYIKVKIQWTIVAGRTERGWSVFRIQSVGHRG